MAPSTAAPADEAVPSASDIERASAFAREPFLLNGSGPEVLVPGTARRRALDAALAEMNAGAEEPSLDWRRNFSLLLGLERLIGDEPPTLRDGAELNPHQIDALSGTLTELIAEQQIAADSGDPLSIGREAPAAEVPDEEPAQPEPETGESGDDTDAEAEEIASAEGDAAADEAEVDEHGDEADEDEEVEELDEEVEEDEAR